MSSAIPETLISDYLDEQLDAEQFEVLRQWILADDAHAWLFLRRAAVHRLAREHFVAAELVAMMGADDADSLDELDLGFDGAIDADAVIAAVEADQRHHEQRAAEALSHQEQQAASAERSWDAIVGRSTIDITPIRHIVIPRWLAYGSGAALAASVLLMLYTLFGFGRGAETPLQPQPGPTTDSIAVAPTSTSIGHITGAVAVKWDDAGVALNMGDPLPQWREQTANFTLEVWIRPHVNLRGNNRIMSTRDAGGGFAWGIAGEDNTILAPARSILFSFYTVKDYASIVPLESGRWSHVVITVDSRGYPTFYIDGEEAGTLVRSRQSEYTRIESAIKAMHGKPSRQPLVLGNNPLMPPGAPTHYLREDEAAYIGDLDHVAIYDHVLDPQTIRMHYLVGSGAPLPDIYRR